MNAKIITAALILLAACNEEKIPTNFQLTEGTYKGLFTRTNPLIFSVPSNVTLVLENGRFTGSSDNNKFPAICTGTYSVSGSEISFLNECDFTADFDWTYILNGKFMIQAENGTIVMSKMPAENTTDTYRLEMQ